ncbi:MAG TPA: TraB/GumN family protein [Gammaproteobacteria bacterium]|nr:TraB/GumN family protein [Gammaproteobacteria bacterium]
MSTDPQDQPPAQEAQEPIETLRLGEVTITLLGTAHISHSSTEKVRELITSNDYDAVAVELCPSRYNAIVNPDALARMDLFQVIREKKTAMVAANLALGAYQQRMADQLNILPGAEMRMAIDCAGESHLPVLLIDREIAVTLKRIYRNVPWWQRINLLAGLLSSVLSRRKISAEEIERLKEGDMLESTFAQFAEEARELFVPLIDERDRYMSARILQELHSGQHRNILVVIGAGHMKGMRDYLPRFEEEKQDTAAIIAELDEIPRPSTWPKLIPWIIVGLILAGFAIGFSQSSELGWSLIADWVVINGALCALGTFIARGHPVTVVSAFVAAPITSLNPTIGAGMVTAAIETYLHRPSVGDFSRLRKDTSHLKGWWKNRVARILLVFLFSTIGSALGTYLAGFRIIDRLYGL